MKSENSGQKFSCYLIGDDSLLIQCCKMLIEKGHPVLGIITSTGNIKSWANENNLPVLKNDSSLEEAIRKTAFDYLFSIANLNIIPEKIISLPLKGSINFHDGPLPKYAGLNATSWAIINEEKYHGITWHLISDGIDKGDILHQVGIKISEHETAFTLNAKCFEAAINSFSVLVDDLSTNNLTGTKQNFEERSYFGKYKKPVNACVISWKSSANKISSLIRGLNFGNHFNPLGIAKLKLQGDYYIVKNAEASIVDKKLMPGTIIEWDEYSITIAATGGAVKISGYETLEGNPVSVRDIISKYKLASGDSIADMTDESYSKLSYLYEQVAKNEAFWINKLSNLEKLEIDLKDVNEETTNASLFKSLHLNIPEELISELKRLTAFDIDDFLKMSFAVFVGRLNSKECFDIGYTPNIIQINDVEGKNLFADIVPLRIDINYDQKCFDLIESTISDFNKIKKNGTYIRDLIARTPSLHKTENKYYDYPVVIKELDHYEKQLPSNAKLTLLNTLNDSKYYWIYNVNEISDDVISVMYEQFIGYLNELTAGFDKIFYDISILTESEKLSLLQLWNQTETEYLKESCIHDLFEKQVNDKPDSVAIFCNGNTITFSQLNYKADLLAAYLKSLGIGSESHIAVSLNRSIDMIIAVLAVLKSGAAYIPVDPAFPKDRIAYIIEDSNCSVLITDSKQKIEFNKDDLLTITLDNEWPKISMEGINPAEQHSSNSLAYIIYTSGSTGKPKGVMVTHRNVVNFFTAMDKQISYSEDSVWLAVTSLSFDISVLELLWTLTRGIQVVLYTGEDIKVKAEESISEGRKTDFSLFYFSSYEGEKDRDKYHLLMEGSKYADRNNFEAVWTPERHFYDFGGLYPNPSITSAALSAITERIKIRAGSVVSPLHSTIRIAEEWSMVDNLSHGRVGVSFAAGWQPNDFVIMPENFKDRKELMFRQIEEVQKLWQGQKVGFTNPNGKTIEINILPKPVQEKLPVWVTAAGNPETFEMAGRLGYNLLTHLLGQSIPELSEKIAIYRRAWKQAGHKGKGILTLMLHTFVGTDEKMVKETVRGPMKHYLKSAVNLVKEAAWSFPTFKNQTTGTDGNFSMDHLSAEDLDAVLDYSFERYYQTSGLFGTPESCKQIIKKLKQTDVDEIACLIDFGVDSDLVLAHLHYLNQVRREANAEQQQTETAGSKYTIAGLIKEQKVTHMQCTPSMAKMLTSDQESTEALSKLKMLLIGGEAFPVKLAERLVEIVSDGEILNMYGPTETTVWSTVYKLKEPVGRTIPIGKPIANTQVYILDKYSQLVPVGIAGELSIGGDGVTKGYYNRPELTEEKFIDNPFTKEPKSKLYRTGDLAYYRKDGTIEFLGRQDHQVKIRGYRIELGEIETVLSSHKDIREAVVISREDSPGDVRLVGYIIPEKKDQPPGSEELKAYLKSKLPEYMIPAQYAVIEKYPLTPNGKIDRKSLPAPVLEQVVEKLREIIQPANELEKQIAGIWEELLKVPKVGISDNFFDSGGHSLLAVQLHQRLKEKMEAEITLIDIFTYPTIRSLVEYISKKKETETENKVKPGSKRAEMSRKRASKVKTRNNGENGDVDVKDFE